MYFSSILLYTGNMNLNHRTIFNVLYLLYFVHFAQGNLDKEMTTKEIVVEIRKNCDYSRVQSKTGESYLGCDCHDLELKEIRKDLRSSIEVSILIEENENITFFFFFS